MLNVSAMSLIVIGIMVAIGGLAAVQAVNHISSKSEFSYRNTGLIDAVVVVMYFLFCGFIGLLYIYAGYDLLVVYGAIALLVAVLLVTFILYCVTNRMEMNKTFLLIFVLYFALVLYLTIFMRVGTIDNSVVATPFEAVRQAIVNKDASVLQHMVLNVLFFVPFGFLVPAMNTEFLKQWSFALFGGLLTSTTIEGAQMIFGLGQADIDDIIANTLGAIIGYGIFRLLSQIRKNWM